MVTPSMVAPFSRHPKVIDSRCKNAGPLNVISVGVFLKTIRSRGLVA